MNLSNAALTILRIMKCVGCETLEMTDEITRALDAVRARIDATCEWAAVYTDRIDLDALEKACRVGLEFVEAMAECDDSIFRKRAGHTLKEIAELLNGIK
jgi:hypothetical protein